jgi:hypothetical protein
MANERIVELTMGKEVVKEIVVPNKTTAVAGTLDKSNEISSAHYYKAQDNGALGL